MKKVASIQFTPTGPVIYYGYADTMLNHERDDLDRQVGNCLGWLKGLPHRPTLGVMDASQEKVVRP